MNLNLVLLFSAYALGFAAIPMLILLASIIAVPMAPSERWATLPLAAMVLGTAFGTLPTAKLMQRFGRRIVIITASLCVIGALYFVSLAVVNQSFWNFCLWVGVIGLCGASFQHFRFIAMESVAPDKASMATSTVLLGGIIAAFIGPELGLWGQHLTDTPFEGSFYLAMISFVFVIVITMALQMPQPTSTSDTSNSSKPLHHSAALWRAIIAGAVGYGLMSFIMTATPLSMHHHFGLSLEATKTTIQAHIMAMFLPSLITPLLIGKIGINRTIVLGTALFGAAIGVGVFSQTHTAFTIALILLGIAWNFLFISGTAALPEAYANNSPYRVQGYNDFFVFGFQALASLSAGWLLSLLGWQWLLLCALVMLMLPIGAVIQYKRIN